MLAQPQLPLHPAREETPPNHTNFSFALRRPALAFAAAERPGELPRLGRHMKRTVREAVVWLIEQSPARDCGHTALALMAVILAKSNLADGRKTRTSVPELAGWLGVGPSTVDKALARLRRVGALATRERYNGGEVVGVDCQVIVPDPRPGHPLAVLRKAELATMLRVCEALFGPGWEPADRPATPPGLLAGRRGRGAATARLALLRILLDTRDDGRLRLAGGRLPKGYGRADATIGRFLSGGPSVGKRALADLVASGVLTKTEKATDTGMDGRAVVRFPAAVHLSAGRARLRLVHDGNPGIPAQSGTAVRVSRPAAEASPQVNESAEGGKPRIPAQSGTADLHAVHASGVSPVGSVQVSSGSPAAGGRGLGTVGGYAPAREGSALRAETNKITNPARTISAAVRAAVPGLLDAMKPGQQGTAARDVAAVLEMPGWNTDRLVDHLARRFAPMSLTDPDAGRGYIGGNPLGWLRSNLPARSLSRRQQQAADEKAERERLERLNDGIDPVAACAEVFARLKAEGPASEARAAAREEAARRVAEYEQARDEAENSIRAELTAAGKTGVALGAWFTRRMRAWHAEHPAPKTTTTAA